MTNKNLMPYEEKFFELVETMRKEGIEITKGNLMLYFKSDNRELYEKVQSTELLYQIRYALWDPSLREPNVGYVKIDI